MDEIKDQVGVRLLDRLTSVGQQHLLAHWHSLTALERSQLADQIDAIDWQLLRRLVRERANVTDWGALANRAQSPRAFRLDDPRNEFSLSEAQERADQHLEAGKLAVVVVAGGQGSRLGFPHPKGMYPIGPVSRRTLFQIHADQLRAVSKRYGTRIPFFVMTSPATHDATLEYFERNHNLGLPAEDLHVFCQGTMPAVDEAGRVLMDSPSSLCLSPDGHGGMLAAFRQSGCLDVAHEFGIEQLFYFQVDNPLVTICDRALVGYHLAAASEMSTLVVAKSDPLEKVGNVVAVDDRMMIIEYSDLPPAAADRRDRSGQLALWAGSIAVHVMDIALLDRVSKSAESLPFHRAHKKVPFIDGEGRQVVPNSPNAIKFERFIFDLLPLSERSIVVEGRASEIFAPLKNASGASKDTPETVEAALMSRAAQWLRRAGAEVAEDARVEIDPTLALDAEQLRSRLRPATRIEGDVYLQ